MGRISSAGTKKIFKSIAMSLQALIIGITAAQSTGDYRSAETGNWTDASTWEVYNGTSWISSTVYPDNKDSAVTVRSGHIITFNSSNISTGRLLVEEGAKLFANSSGVYRYLSAFDDIICNGTIGNDTIVDGICLKPEGDTVNLSGAGSCKFRRIRKDADSSLITVFLIDMIVEVHYNGSGYALYNNKPGTYLDIYIEPGAAILLHAKMNLLRSHLTINSSPSGTGQLICSELVNSVGINTDVKQYIPHDNSWHFLSSPVEDQVIQYFFTPSPPDNSFDFYKWDEGLPESTAWVNIKDSTGGIDPDFEYEFVEGRGYLVAYDPNCSLDEVKTFHGTMLDGNQALAVTQTINGWNLVGNPYPCGLDWSSSGINKSLVSGQAAYFWDQELNDGIGGYRTHNGETGVPLSTSPVIPPMNGFFVFALGNGSIDIDISNDSPQVLCGQNFYKEEFLSCANLRFAVVRGDYKDEAVASFGPWHYNGFEAAEDALKLFRSHPEVPEIYSISDGRELVINRLSDNYPDIPLGFVTHSPDSLTLHFYEVETIDRRIDIWLEDHFTGAVVPVRRIPKYQFYSEEGIFDDRFKLFFKKHPKTVSREGLSAYVSISLSNGSLQLISKTDRAGTLMVYDCLGRVIEVIELAGVFKECNTLNLQPGVYFISLLSQEGKLTRKLLIH
jgi:hypothetical protein